MSAVVTLAPVVHGAGRAGRRLAVAHGRAGGGAVGLEPARRRAGGRRLDDDCARRASVRRDSPDAEPRAGSSSPSRPSQLAPSGSVFSTAAPQARNAVVAEAAARVTGTATPRASLTTCSTSAQSTAAPCGSTAFCAGLSTSSRCVCGTAHGRRPARVSFACLDRSSSCGGYDCTYRLSPLPAVHERLVHHRDLGADRHHVEQLLDVLGVHADAAVARAQADAGGLVGAVDQVARPAEVHRAVAERVVRSRRHARRQRIALGRVLLAHRRAAASTRDSCASRRSWSCPTAWPSRPCRCRSGR